MFRQNNTELFNEKYQDKYIHTTNYLEKCLWHRFNLRLAPNWQSSFSLLPNQRLMNMRNDSTSSNGGLDQSIQLFISTDGQLKIEKLIKIIIVMFFFQTCRCLGVILFTFRSLEAFPANSRTSAVRYSRMAEL